MFKVESVFDSNLKTNWDRNCAEQPLPHTIELFSVAHAVVFLSVVFSDSSLLIVTDSHIFYSQHHEDSNMR